MPRLSPAAVVERRQRILDAAATCLEGEGRALTARAVAAEAGISIGALYHHFAGLDALREALAEQRLVAGIAAVAARAPAGEDPVTWAVRALVCAPPLGVPGAGAFAPPGVGRVVRATVDEVLRAARVAGTLGDEVDVEALGELLELVWEAVDRRVESGSLRTPVERLAATFGALLAAGCRPPRTGERHAKWLPGHGAGQEPARSGRSREPVHPGRGR